MDHRAGCGFPAGGVAVVTGASSGVGRAIALELARQGAMLLLLGRKRVALETVAGEVRHKARVVEIHNFDLTVREDIQKFVGAVTKTQGRVDALIHSAGVIALGTLESSPVEDLEWQLNTNVIAPYALTRALLPLLKSGKGQVVCINSTAGIQADAGVAQYAATKHALRAFTNSLRQEVNADSVRVLSVFLGRTATPMQQAIHAQEGKPYHSERLIQPEDVAAVVVNALSLPRTAEVTEIHMRPFLKPL
ncbi:MAG TPA: SDR family oxidoreductase [Candidatus Binatia bacterium]|jgi:short-subunit dehydrogenase|nr:SDR family oxidoreductase [Candidatus Binatia bacterium]